jgi:oxygen-independent coproporphyrinogen-3 oxidase
VSDILAGLYVHIPFCRSRCIYCAFYSTTSLKWRDRYVDALCREWQMRRNELSQAIDTVYIGGGTPSQLTPRQLSQLFSVLPGNAQEVTMEVNPDDVTAAYADLLQQLGVNRVSMGAQTFNDQRLRFLHRRHNADQVSLAVQRLRDAGIHNISVDLMYGFPGERLADWQHDIDAVLALDVEHISAYCLTIEEGTPLWKLTIDNSLRNATLDRGQEFTMNEELERQMYETLIDQLTAAGYEHYEISNFAKPGYRSRHNSSYWHDVPYVGLGAAAHSYDGHCRSWNVSNLQQYAEAIERAQLPSEREVLDADTHYNDRITTALRTSDGLDLTMLDEKYRRYCLHEAEPFIKDGLLRQDADRLILTRKGLFVSDMVMSSLMLV